MLSSACWVIVDPTTAVPIEGKTYLRHEDAEDAIDVLRTSPLWKSTDLTIREQTLVLLFGVTDQKVNGASLLKNARETAYPKRFELQRTADPSGVSGTGLVAEGVLFSDGTVALRWMTKHRSSGFYNTLMDVEAIHGHDGATKVVFFDQKETE